MHVDGERAHARTTEEDILKTSRWVDIQVYSKVETIQPSNLPLGEPEIVLEDLRAAARPDPLSICRARIVSDINVAEVSVA